jgi:glycine/sarcosine N-methyltransferase
MTQDESTRPAQAVSLSDGLPGSYHLIYADWEGAAERQARALDTVIRRRVTPPPAPALLDCSCGIGTQALGLAALGWEVTATDACEHAVERCRREADERGLALSTQVTDMRCLADEVQGRFDVVLSCDDAVSHLPGRWDLMAALRGMRAGLATGGLVVIGVRDNGQTSAEPPAATPARVFTRADLTDVLGAAGFTDIRWTEPTDSGHFEPLVTAIADEEAA